MDFNLIVTLIVLLLFIVMMLSGKFAYSLVGITCVSILVLTGVLSISEGFAGFADKNVIMLAGMFGLAGMLGKTSMGDFVKDKLLTGKGGGSSFRLALTLLIIAAIFGQLMTSQTSIIMIMMSFLLVIEDKEVTISRILLPLTFVMTTWMGKTPLGGPGVTTYIMLNQFIEAAGGTEMLDVLSLMKCTLIPGIIAILYSAFTYKMLPKKEINASAYAQNNKQGNVTKMSSKNERIVYVAFVLSVIGLLLAGKIGERAYIFPLVICVVLMYLKVMSGKEFLQMLTSGPVIMCATILVVANAVTASGAGNLIGEIVIKILGGNPAPWMIVTVFGIVALITTTFISNTASFMVLVPIACNVCLTAGYDPRATVVTVFSAALLSVMTPMANTGSAVTYSICNLNVKEGFLWAFPGAIICLAATIVNSLIIYPM